MARPPAWQVLLFLAVFLDHIEYRRAVMAMAPSNLAGSDILAGWDESMAWIRARVGDVPACAEGLERAVDSLAHLGRMEDEECAARSIVSLGCAASDTWMDLERLAHRVDVAQLPCEFEGVRIGLHIVAMSAADSLARSASETIERVNTLARDWKSTEPLPVCWTVAADWRVLFAELAKLSGGT